MTTPRYRDIHAPVPFDGGQETLLFGTIARRMNVKGYSDGTLEEDWINLNPEYQRGHVWTVKQQEAFVGHMLEGGATPIVILNRDANYRLPDEIVDGKQRLTAVVAWICGEIAARLTDSTRVYRTDFSADDQRLIMGPVGPHFTAGYVHLNRADVLRLYLRLNTGGTVHTDAEISRVQAMLDEHEDAPPRCKGRKWVQGPKGEPVGTDWVLTGLADPAYAPPCPDCEDCR